MIHLLLSPRKRFIDACVNLLKRIEENEQIQKDEARLKKELQNASDDAFNAQQAMYEQGILSQRIYAMTGRLI